MSRLYPVALLLCLLSCGNSNSSQNEEGEASTPVTETPDSTAIPQRDTPIQKPAPAGLFTYDKDGLPTKNVYAKAENKEKCFIVISKVHPEHLSVYEARGKDTVVLAIYPACLARNKGQKEKKGDNKTPESYPGKPFSISQIQDAHDWHHDFGDGRGAILAYGHWFMRLVTPGFSGIGIHGSTNNRESIKNGRGSEGCIRLLDEDIIHLKDNFAQVGMPVIILPEGHAPLPFEVAALKKVPQTVKTGPAVSPQPSNPKIKQEEPNTGTPAVKKDYGFVTVTGERQMLRSGPERNDEKYPIYADNNGRPICPENGDRLECLGEENGYYKVRFDGKELYINKESCKIGAR